MPIVVLFVVFFLSAPIYADLFVKEAHKDFGNVRRGDVLEHQFEIQNTSSADLTIAGIHADCGCVLVDAPANKTLAPKESTSIRVQLDTQNFVGVLKKTIVVVSEEKGPKPRTLQMSANIASDFIVTKPVVYFGAAMVGDHPTESTEIRAVTAEAEVVGLDFDSTKLASSLEPIGAKLWKLKVQLTDTKSAVPVVETVVIKTKNSALKNIPILIRGEVLGRFKLESPYLEFGRVARPITREIRLHEMRGLEVVSGVESLFVNGIQVTNTSSVVSIVIRDGLASIRLTPSAGMQGSVHGRLVFETQDSIHEKIHLDIYAFMQNSVASKGRD